MPARTGHRPRGTAGTLAAVWFVLIAYASLFPFTGWHWPPGAGARELLMLPWPRYWDAFDVWANLLGYVPMGLLWSLALQEANWRGRSAALGAATGSALLSLAMECTQQLLPHRVPSAADWVLNSAGGSLGAVLAVLLHRVGMPQAWRRVFGRWFEQGDARLVMLLLLWPAALLVPAPVPLALGQVGTQVRTLILDLVADVPWADPAFEWLQPGGDTPPLNPTSETLLALLGLLAPCLLAYAASRPSWRRAVLALGAPIVAAGATTLSTALNFGPAHALAWRLPGIPTAWIAATGVALLLVWIGPRTAAALALMALTGLVVLVHLAPSDPYYAQSLQAWEQGRFIHFYGLSRWLAWLWPYAAMAWLLVPRTPPRMQWPS